MKENHRPSPKQKILVVDCRTFVCNLTWIGKGLCDYQ